MRWYVVAPFEGPSEFVADDLVFVQDRGSEAENLAAARSAFATARILMPYLGVAKVPQPPLDRL